MVGIWKAVVDTALQENRNLVLFDITANPVLFQREGNLMLPLRRKIRAGFIR